MEIKENTPIDKAVGSGGTPVIPALNPIVKQFRAKIKLKKRILSNKYHGVCHLFSEVPRAF